MKVGKTSRAIVIASRTVYSGSVFDVQRDRVREPGGVEATRDIIVHRGSVVLLPVREDGQVLLVRQYRHAARQFLWELVAGRIERGENGAQAARRELLEETGYTGRRYRRLMEFFPTPGFVTERMALYLVEGLRAGMAQPEEDEKIEVGAFPLAEIEGRIQRGTIRDGKTIAGVLYYSRFVANRDGG